MQRSFASLTAQEALHVGICIEDRNAELYHGFAELFTEFGDEESLEIAERVGDRLLIADACIRCAITVQFTDGERARSRRYWYDALEG